MKHAFALAALGVVACGGFVEAGGGPPPNRRDGGIGGAAPDDAAVVIDSTCSIGGTTSDGGSEFGPECAAFCPVKTHGNIEFRACCTPVFGSCGSLVEKPLMDWLPLYPGCYAPMFGSVDTSCPPHTYFDPATAQPKTFAGCCLEAKCGVVIDLSSSGGPAFGCIEIASACGQPSKSCGGPPNCAGCVQAQCEPEFQACFSESNCLVLMTCAESCATESCLKECETTDAAQPSSWQSLKACAKDKCDDLCPI